MYHYHVQKVDLKSLKYVDLALSGEKSDIMCLFLFFWHKSSVCILTNFYKDAIKTLSLKSSHCF